MKIEFEVPEFEKELSINITIRRDGEVVCNTSTSPSLVKNVPESTKKKKVESNKSEGNTPDKPAGKLVGGNLMNLDNF